MAFDNENTEAETLAREIASLTGQSPAAAMADALRRRRDELRRERERQVATMLHRAVDIARRTPAYVAPRHVDVDAFFATQRRPVREG